MGEGARRGLPASGLRVAERLGLVLAGAEGRGGGGDILFVVGLTAVLGGGLGRLGVLSCMGWD
jgi:hypothetical protein